MAGRTIDERMRSLQAEAEELEKKRQQLKARQRDLQRSITERDRKARTHRLIEIGAAVESVLGHELPKDDIPVLMAYLKDQNERGGYFSKALAPESKYRIRKMDATENPDSKEDVWGNQS